MSSTARPRAPTRSTKASSPDTLDDALRAAGPDDPVEFPRALAEMYREERRSVAELVARMTERPD